MLTSYPALLALCLCVLTRPLPFSRTSNKSTLPPSSGPIFKKHVITITSTITRHISTTLQPQSSLQAEHPESTTFFSCGPLFVPTGAEFAGDATPSQTDVQSKKKCFTCSIENGPCTVTGEGWTSVFAYTSKMSGNTSNILLPNTSPLDGPSTAEASPTPSQNQSETTGGELGSSNDTIQTAVQKGSQYICEYAKGQACIVEGPSSTKTYYYTTPMPRAGSTKPVSNDLKQATATNEGNGEDAGDRMSILPVGKIPSPNPPQIRHE